MHTRSHTQTKAHPRSRGENQSILASNVVARGSSPLTRGKPQLIKAPFGMPGLIPAHAGKTRHVQPGILFRPAHPRSRGENHTRPPHVTQNTGSSPLTRGKQSRSYSASRAIGLIPAHAGKTYFLFVLPRRTRAHPRSRGENSFRGRTRTKHSGSSPLTRGKLRLSFRFPWPIRLIPAHAGKTCVGIRRAGQVGAHPRSRGENERLMVRYRIESGSSPLTRGKRRSRPPRVGPGGLIPAHAGKTRGHPSIYRYRRAHPRSRGENGQRLGPCVVTIGSSPLTRGKLVFVGFDDL